MSLQSLYLCISLSTRTGLNQVLYVSRLNVPAYANHSSTGRIEFLPLSQRSRPTLLVMLTHFVSAW